MFLQITTTHQPATDLGYLLHKNPGRSHEVELAFGKARLFYPEANEARCTAALVLDIDPVALVRGKGSSEGLLAQYVNDRPYAASSFLSVAMGRALREAIGGRSRERQVWPIPRSRWRSPSRRSPHVPAAPISSAACSSPWGIASPAKSCRSIRNVQTGATATTSP